MLRLVWLIPLLPLAGFAVNLLLGRFTKLSERAVSIVACGAVLLSLLITLGAFFEYASSYAPANDNKPFVTTLFNWLPGGLAQLSLGSNAGSIADFSINWGYQVDQLSLVMMFVVTFVGFWIHVFAVGYMHGDKGFYRFFAYLNLFMFMMLVLVMGSNFLVMFVGWEGVGLCSYLLIGYYFDRQEAADASKKAFVVNRIGDFGFALAIMGAFAAFGTLEFSEIHTLASSYPVEALGAFGLMSWLALGLFIGAAGKSAQIPLYIWLPDAMAGPTPVSALIHAATMVTAGVFMVVRTNFIFQRSATMMFVVAAVGCLTAFVAATIGITQTDIKKVLAYSTVSQLGYMFLGAGVGAFIAAIFHVFTHAFFKALLFLGSGSVIHGMHHEQEMPRMGGLAKYMPVTYKTMWIGWLAICGIVPFAGFWSKDEILGGAFTAHIPGGKVLWFIGLFTAGLTAFYMTRLMALTFWGEERFRKAHGSGEQASHSGSHGEPHRPVEPRESPSSMTIPLIVLAAGSLVAGLLGIPHMSAIEHWLDPVIANVGEKHAAPGWSLIVPLMIASLGVAAAGIVLGIRFYLRQPGLASQWAEKLRPLYTLSVNKWYLDYLLDVKGVEAAKAVNNACFGVDSAVVDGGVNGAGWLTRFSARVSGWWDKWVIDLAVNMTGWITRAGSLIFRTFQTGFWQNYALLFTLGLLFVLAYYAYPAIVSGSNDLYQNLKGPTLWIGLAAVAVIVIVFFVLGRRQTATGEQES
jgi:NADH-quinone oxidoreductase subunit L